MAERTDLPLAGKVAVVTGATRGIGRAVALALRDAGATVHAHGRDRAAGRDVADLLGTRFVEADLADPDGPQALVDALAGEPRIDVLVNNAAVEIAERASGLRREDLVESMDVNVHAPTALVQLLLPRLAAGGGSVVNVSSLHEAIPYPHHLAYSASKAALAMVTATLAVQLAPQGVRVNGVAPGIVETDINRATIERFGRDRLERRVPLGRLASPDDVTGAVVFLASDASRYVTGTTIHVDGALRHSLVDYGEPAPDRD